MWRWIIYLSFKSSQSCILLRVYLTHTNLTPISNIPSGLIFTSINVLIIFNHNPKCRCAFFVLMLRKLSGNIHHEQDYKAPIRKSRRRRNEKKKTNIGILDKHKHQDKNS